jgi:hypothetical protein
LDICTTWPVIIEDETCKKEFFQKMAQPEGRMHRMRTETESRISWQFRPVDFTY